MIACAHAQRLLPLLYDGELDSPLRRELSHHVADCSVCTRTVALLNRSQELLRQTIDEHIDDIDFSGFWQGVESKLSQQPPFWWARLRFWKESWLPSWSWQTPAWATAVAFLIVGATMLLSQSPSQEPIAKSPVVENDEAHIESLSTSNPVLVWNEPTYNATVIWVGDESEEELP